MSLEVLSQILWVALGILIGRQTMVGRVRRALGGGPRPVLKDWAAPVKCPHCGDQYNVIYQGACPRCTAKRRASLMGIPPE